MIFTLVVGLPAGVAALLRRGKRLDHTMMGAAQVGELLALADVIDERILYSCDRRFLARMLFLADPGELVFLVSARFILAACTGCCNCCASTSFP